MSELLSKFDAWINEGGPSALVIKEYLESAAGPGEVIFPPTFAPSKDKGKKTQTDTPPKNRGTSPSGYVIDGEGENSICLLDSVGSQANRLEPIFKMARYRNLVPQVQIRVKTKDSERVVNLLDVGHRAADALVRSTELAPDLERAFTEYAAGQAVRLARIAPTSLVFGAWDSRGSQEKVPRLVGSTIRAFGVRKLSRAAQYFSALDKDEVEELLQMNAQSQKTLLSSAGFLDAPSGMTHGGVIANGDIARTTIINLTALRALGALDAGEQKALRLYILGLALVAAFAPIDFFLRQGCLLVRSIQKLGKSEVVYRDGRREAFAASLEKIESFAELAAEAFGVVRGPEVLFDPKLAKKLVNKASKDTSKEKEEED